VSFQIKIIKNYFGRRGKIREVNLSKKFIPEGFPNESRMAEVDLNITRRK
jgi:hypothetical protein